MPAFLFQVSSHLLAVLGQERAKARKVRLLGINAKLVHRIGRPTLRIAKTREVIEGHFPDALLDLSFHLLIEFAEVP
jgi:hypothetical protein